MSAPNPDIDDLLSGMLDSMLTLEESIFLEHEMANEPSLQARFDELAFLRRSLLSGRTVATLGPDFASAVTLAAKARARELEQVVPESKIFDEPKAIPLHEARQVPKTRNHHRWLRWIYVGAVSMATVVFFLVYSAPGPDNTRLISDADAIWKERGSASTNTTSNDLALSEDQLVREIAKDIVEKMDHRPVGPETIADSVPMKGKQDEILDSRIADIKTDSSTVESDLKPKPKVESNLAYFLYVLDVTVTQAAVENRALERILEQHQIVYTDDLAISDDQLEMLEKSKMTGGNSVANAERMGVVFLRSSERRLGSAIKDIILQYQDFPDFAQNISTDRSATELVEQLCQIQVAAGSVGVAQRFARSKTPDVSYPFASSARVGKPMSQEKRLESAKKPSLLSGDALANALILLRPAKP